MILITDMMIHIRIFMLFIVIIPFSKTNAGKCKCGSISTDIDPYSPYAKYQGGPPPSNSRLWGGMNVTEVGRYPWQILLMFTFGDRNIESDG